MKYVDSIVISILIFIVVVIYMGVRIEQRCKFKPNGSETCVWRIKR